MGASRTPLRPGPRSRRRGKSLPGGARAAARRRRPPVYLVLQTSPEDGAPSLGPLYVGQALRDAGFPVRVASLDGDLAQRARRLRELIDTERPLFVGFSTVISDSLAANVELSKLAHALGVTVVWGGIFATTLPRVVAAEPYVDYVVVGEGERPVVALAAALLGGDRPVGVPGIAYRDGDEIVVQPPAPQEPDLDRFRFGVELIDWEPHLVRTPERTLFLPFSRGCPFRCAFCYNCTIAGTEQWRVHGADYLNDLVRFFRERYQVRSFFFIGDNLFGKVAAAQRLIEQLHDIRWIGCVHPACVSGELLDWAMAHGCMGIALGVESGSDAVLRTMRKGATAATMRTCLHLSAERKLPVLASYIGFMPGETPADRQQTAALMEEAHEAHRSWVMKYHIFRAYPGTEYWDASLQLGLTPPVTLAEWAEYRPEINHLLGYSRDHVLEVKDLMWRLYVPGTPRQARGPLERAMLRSRLEQLLAQ